MPRQRGQGGARRCPRTCSGTAGGSSRSTRTPSAILGEQVYRTLADVPEQVGLVDVFRPSGQTPDIARQAVAAGATALWLQLGIASAEARAIAEDAGLLYVEDRCLVIEQRRLNLDAPGR